MRILYLNHDENRTGTTIALLNLLDGIVKEGHQVFVIKPLNNGFLGEELLKRNIPFYSLPLRCKTYPSSKNWLLKIKGIIGYYWRNTINQKKVEKIIKNFNPDIVHTNSGMLDVALTPCLKLHKPHVWHIREAAEAIGLYPFPSTNAYNKRLQTKGNYNIAVSKYVFDFRGLSKKDIIIYDGVFSKWHYLESIPQKKIILYIGAITEYKGITTLLLAFKKFHSIHSEYKLHLVGSVTKSNQNYYLKCLDYIKENALNEHISFLGSRNDTYNLLASASAVVIPTFNEGFGFVTAEAMLNKTFVIGRNSAGTKEQLDICFEEAGHELGFRFNDDESLFHGLCYAVENDTKEVCEHARKIVLNKYSIEDNCNTVLKYYSQILQNYK